MIPVRFQEGYDPEPDYERADAEYDMRREEGERRRWDSGFLDYQGSVGAGEGERQRAAGEAGEGSLF